MGVRAAAQAASSPRPLLKTLLPFFFSYPLPHFLSLATRLRCTSRTVSLVGTRVRVRVSVSCFVDVCMCVCVCVCLFVKGSKCTAFHSPPHPHPARYVFVVVVGTECAATRTTTTASQRGDAARSAARHTQKVQSSLWYLAKSRSYAGASSQNRVSHDFLRPRLQCAFGQHKCPSSLFGFVKHR